MDKLTHEVHQVEEQIALLEAQWHAQAQDTKSIKEAVTAASMEMEVRSQGCDLIDSVCSCICMYMICKNLSIL